MRAGGAAQHGYAAAAYAVQLAAKRFTEPKENIETAKDAAFWAEDAEWFVLHQGISFEIVDLLRDIFGNPFRSVAINPAWLKWNDATIPRLAQRIYDERRFEDLPILADALEEAGCTNADILEHCRGPGPHVRGCWVVDLILAKE